MNSREKGKRGERAWRDELRAHGYEARRGQQFAGGGDSPDVVSELPYHFEVKCVEALNLRDAVDQAVRDSAGTSKPPVVAHKRNHSPWLVTMLASDWFNLVREAFPAREAGRRAQIMFEETHAALIKVRAERDQLAAKLDAGDVLINRTL